MTPGQFSIIVDHDHHARLAIFELLPTVPKLSLAELKNVVFVAPEILEGADVITPGADIFSFGMLVIQVDPCPFSHQ